MGFHAKESSLKDIVVVVALSVERRTAALHGVTSYARNVGFDNRTHGWSMNFILLLPLYIPPKTAKQANLGL